MISPASKPRKVPSAMPVKTTSGSGGGAVSVKALRDKLDDDVLDLSLMQLEEVPVKEMVSN